MDKTEGEVLKERLFNDKKVGWKGLDEDAIRNIFKFSEKNIKTNPDKYINQAFELSNKLSEDFTFVRVDFMFYKNQLFFEELTFTPYSGFHFFGNKKIEINLGNFLYIGEKN